ncbi:hypothetical protein [uncultured Algoriphagus sp.]|uniref:hypothetical protein n=1 Tax=uncultured Algoriphagus sp. TaxID=417365 RepID=UPI0030ECA5F4
MSKRKIQSICYLAFTPLLLFGCDFMENIFPDKDNDGVIIANLNEIPFEAEGGKGFLAKEFLKAELEESEDYYLLTVYGIRVQDDKKALALGFQLAGNDISEITAGSTYSNWVLLDEKAGKFEGAKGAVEMRNSVKSDNSVFKASSFYTGEIKLTITEIDLSKREFSGSFQFSALDSQVDTLFQVTEGNFENVKWKAL